ncbi:MAG: hypothetical protein FWE67_07230 [Planctomycetaceae bacterium]|nr:hypothetical protein [Planctomycetaceae bacterium]
MYKTKFYARTWICWAGVLLLGPIVAGWLIMGLLIVLGIDKPPPEQDGVPDSALLIIGLLCTPMVFSLVFQVYARQTPILKMHREGIKIRVVWTPISSSGLVMYVLWLFPPLAFFIYALVMLWRLLSFQLFRIRTFYIPWDDTLEIAKEKNAFTITAWNYREENTSQVYEYMSFFYCADSFGTSIRKVSESIQFFLHNPDSREFLPNWRDEDTMFGNSTFDSR